MSDSNNNDFINMDLEYFYLNNKSYNITKVDRDNIINSFLYKNVDLILDKILDKINLKHPTKTISKEDIIYFDNLFKNSKDILNNKTKEGDTLLHNMVFFGCYEVVKLLIKYGCQVNIEDVDKQIPLHRSIFLSNIKILKLLLKSSKNINNDINHKDKDGNTPLHLSILIKNYLIIDNLLKFGADPYILNDANLVPLDLAKDKNKNFDINIIQIFKKYLK